MTTKLYYSRSELYGVPALCTAEQLNELDQEFGGDADWNSDSNIEQFDLAFVREYVETQILGEDGLDDATAQQIYDAIMARYEAGNHELAFRDWTNIYDRLTQKSE